MSYDERCEDLALIFLEEIPGVTDEDVKELAQERRYHVWSSESDRCQCGERDRTVNDGAQ